MDREEPRRKIYEGSTRRVALRDKDERRSREELSKVSQ
jgi:hypothetical protein